MSIAVLYHGNFGHTQKVAEHIAQGAGAHTQARVFFVSELDDDDWAWIDEARVLVFGSAVYMGSVTAPFKTFMDATSRRWYTRAWAGKWAAGFANSGGLGGDKLAVLQQICLFAMQHGMHWAGMPLMPTGHSPDDLNRLSGFLGLMTQSDNLPPEQTPPAGDLASAQWFGDYLATLIT